MVWVKNDWHLFWDSSTYLYAHTHIYIYICILYIYIICIYIYVCTHIWNISLLDTLEMPSFLWAHLLAKIGHIWPHSGTSPRLQPNPAGVSVQVCGSQAAQGAKRGEMVQGGAPVRER